MPAYFRFFFSAGAFAKFVTQIPIRRGDQKSGVEFRGFEGES